MQAESDIFLGWTRVTGPDGIDRDFYMRQLKDWKFSMPIEAMVPAGMTAYARLRRYKGSLTPSATVSGVGAKPGYKVSSRRQAFYVVLDDGL